MFVETYEWFLGMLEEDDPETGRLVRRIGKEILANKPVAPMDTGASNIPINERMEYFMNIDPIDRLTTPGVNYKWQNIGRPLFGPAIELGFYFTPMNPLVRRLARALYTGLDLSESNY